MLYVVALIFMFFYTPFPWRHRNLQSVCLSDTKCDAPNSPTQTSGLGSPAACLTFCDGGGATTFFNFQPGTGVCQCYYIPYCNTFTADATYDLYAGSSPSGVSKSSSNLLFCPLNCFLALTLHSSLLCSTFNKVCPNQGPTGATGA